jgi:hypothetical protein
LISAVSLFALVSHADILYVGESGSSRIGAYSTSGATNNASLITGLSEPCDIKITPAGNLLVTCEGGTPKLALYTPSGAALNSVLTTMSGNYDYFEGAVQVGTNIVAVVENSASVPSYGLSGNTVVSTNSTFLSLDTKYPGSIVTDGTYYYINDTLFGQLQKYTISGSLVNRDLATTAIDFGYMAIDGTNLFVAFQSLNKVAEYSTSGQVINTNLISGLNEPLGIAADGRGHLFVANYGNGKIGEYGTDGSVINPALISNLNGVSAVAVQRTAPNLNISETGGVVSVTWLALTNYFLQTNNNLLTANWSVDANIAVNNGTNIVSIAQPTKALYFRLESTNGY